MDEVEEEIGLGMKAIPVIEVQDGIYGYFRCSYIDDLGDEEYFCKYVRVGNNTDWKIRNLKGFLDIILD